MAHNIEINNLRVKSTYKQQSLFLVFVKIRTATR